VLHDNPEHRWLQEIPLLVFGLGDGHEIGTKEHPGKAVYGEQSFGQGRAPSRGRIGEIGRGRASHLAPGKELEGRRIRRLFGLYEHRDDLLNRSCWTTTPSSGAERSYRPLNVINPGAKFKRHAQPSPKPQTLDFREMNYFTIS
jgi:hypothetical protein